MNKEDRSIRCPYCLQYSEQVTVDHIIPDSWYPEDSNSNFEKWKVPCCQECNNKYSKLEQSLLIKLGLCLSPDESKNKGIIDKTMRSINPIYGRDEKDKIMRKAKRQKIIRNAEILKQIPSQGIFPNFGPQEDIKYPFYVSVLLPENEIKYFGYKLLRGITYFLDKEFIEPEYNMEIHVLYDIDAKPVVEFIEKNGKTYNLGAGVKIIRGLAIEDKNSALFVIAIWGKFKLYGSIIKK